MMPRTYSTEYRLQDIDRDTEALMNAVQIRCPQSVELLTKKYKKPARQLALELEPRHRKRRVEKRLASLVRRVFGLTPTDPMRSFAQLHIKRGMR